MRGGLFDYQVIVVDDESKDNTLKILQTLKSVYSNLWVISQKNSGPGIAREKAISQVPNCDYLAFCDADDWVEPDWLMSMYRCIKDTGADFIKFRAYVDRIGAEKLRADGTGEITLLNQEEAVAAFIEHKRLNGILWTNLFKRELFNGVHFNPKLFLFEDADVIVKLLWKSRTIALCDTAKYHYVVGMDSLSNGKTNLRRIESTILFGTTL